MTDQETGHAGEFVGLYRQNLDEQFIVGQIGAGQPKTVGEVGPVQVNHSTFGAGLIRLQLIQRFGYSVLRGRGVEHHSRRTTGASFDDFMHEWCGSEYPN